MCISPLYWPLKSSSHLALAAEKPILVHHYLQCIYYLGMSLRYEYIYKAQYNIVFSSNGYLCVGARVQTASVLSKLAEVKDLQDSLRTKEAELTAVESELGSLKGTAEKWVSVSNISPLQILTDQSEQKYKAENWNVVLFQISSA